MVDGEQKGVKIAYVDCTIATRGPGAMGAEFEGQGAAVEKKVAQIKSLTDLPVGVAGGAVGGPVGGKGVAGALPPLRIESPTGVSLMLVFDVLESRLIL